MLADWDQPLTDEEADRLIQNLAQEIVKRKMEVPAVLFLEMHRPFARIAGNALIVFSPFLAPFVGIGNVSTYSRLLERPGSLQQLISEIESRQNETVQEVTPPCST